jgi:death-on-curing family protein
MNTMYTLTLEHITTINAQFGVPVGMRNVDGLRSALARPLSLGSYAGADLAAQATALIEGIAQAHAFVDGNKRTATAAGLVWLRLHGAALAPSDALRADPAADGPPAGADALGAQVVALVTHAHNASDAAAWLQARMTPAADLSPDAALNRSPDEDERALVPAPDDWFDATLAAVLQAHAATFAYLADR